MATNVRFRKGPKSLLPSIADSNVLLFTTDTHELFLGNDSAPLSKISDILFYINYSAFPELGKTNKLYFDKATSKLYMWSGAVYLNIADNHDHINLELLESLDILMVEGKLHLTHDGSPIAFLQDTTFKLDHKADLVNGTIPLNQLPKEIKQTKVVANIAARNAILAEDLFAGLVVWVIDASGDVTVDSGAAMYIHDGSTWQKLAEVESMEFDFSVLMLGATFDSNDDGIVDVVEAIDGIEDTLENYYYGKDASAVVGFHELPVTAWNEFVVLETVYEYAEEDFNILPDAYKYSSEIEYNVTPDSFKYSDNIEYNVLPDAYKYDDNIEYNITP